MKRRTAIITAIVAFIVPFLLLGTYALSSLSHTPVREAKTTPQSKYDVGPPDASELLELVNAERAKYGVAPLVMDEVIAEVAQTKADDMVKNNYSSHIMPEYGTILSPQMQQITHTRCTSSSENIRDNDEYINTSREAFDAWVNSAPHHKAMVRADYTSTGFGINSDRVVQHFCTVR